MRIGPIANKAVLAVGVIVCWSAQPAHAADEGKASLFQWDNDKVADTDRHYTNGMRIAMTYDAPPNGTWLNDAGAFMARQPWFLDHGTLRSGWVFGQDMYTPDNVNAHVPDPTDRPYAGWTYAGLSVQREDGPRQDTFEASLGVVGPAAKAGEVQNWFHRQINVAPSNGWAHQIHNEVGVLATRTTKWRTTAHNVPYTGFLSLGGLQADVIGHGTAQLGNVRSGAALGATVRLGANLDQDFGPIFGGYALPHARPQRPTWSLFAGAEGRWAAHDIFLDGNTWRDSPEVKRIAWLGEMRLGASMHWPLDPKLWITGVRVNLNWVERTREFVSQSKNDRYGSFQLTLNY